MPIFHFSVKECCHKYCASTRNDEGQCTQGRKCNNFLGGWVSDGPNFCHEASICSAARGGADCQKLGWKNEQSEQKWDLGAFPQNFFRATPSRTSEDAPFQDRIQIVLIIDLKCSTLFASPCPPQTTNEKANTLNFH